MLHSASSSIAPTCLPLGLSLRLSHKQRLHQVPERKKSADTNSALEGDHTGRHRLCANKVMMVKISAGPHVVSSTSNSHEDATNCRRQRGLAQRRSLTRRRHAWLLWGSTCAHAEEEADKQEEKMCGREGVWEGGNAKGVVAGRKVYAHAARSRRARTGLLGRQARACNTVCNKAREMGGQGRTGALIHEQLPVEEVGATLEVVGAVCTCRRAVQA